MSFSGKNKLSDLFSRNRSVPAVESIKKEDIQLEEEFIDLTTMATKTTETGPVLSTTSVPVSFKKPGSAPVPLPLLTHSAELRHRLSFLARKRASKKKSTSTSYYNKNASKYDDSLYRDR